MIKIERISKDRLDIAMSGKLDSEGMAKALDELVEKSEGIENGKMLYDVVDYQLPSLGAITLEFSRMPQMFGLIRRFRRAAGPDSKAEPGPEHAQQSRHDAAVDRLQRDPESPAWPAGSMPGSPSPSRRTGPPTA